MANWSCVALRRPNLAPEFMDALSFCLFAGGFKEQLDRLSDVQRHEVLAFLGGVLKSELDQSKAEADAAVAAAKEETTRAQAKAAPASGGSMLDHLSWGPWGTMTFQLPGAGPPASPPLGRGVAALQNVAAGSKKGTKGGAKRTPSRDASTPPSKSAAVIDANPASRQRTKAKLKELSKASPALASSAVASPAVASPAVASSADGTSNRASTLKQDDTLGLMMIEETKLTVVDEQEGEEEDGEEDDDDEEEDDDDEEREMLEQTQGAEARHSFGLQQMAAAVSLSMATAASAAAKPLAELTLHAQRCVGFPLASYLPDGGHQMTNTLNPNGNGLTAQQADLGKTAELGPLLKASNAEGAAEQLHAGTEEASGSDSPVSAGPWKVPAQSDQQHHIRGGYSNAETVMGTCPSTDFDWAE